jgi:hypothetical protein
MTAVHKQADEIAPEGTPAWTAAYRQLLLAPAPPGGVTIDKEGTAATRAAIAPSQSPFA